MAALPQLPQVPLGLPAHGVPPPNAPTQNPPTLIDVANAHDYNERLAAARNAARYGKCANYDMRFLTTSSTGPGGLPTPTTLDIAEGLMYEKAIMELVGEPGLSILLRFYNTLTSFLQRRDAGLVSSMERQGISAVERNCREHPYRLGNFPGPGNYMCKFTIVSLIIVADSLRTDDAQRANWCPLRLYFSSVAMTPQMNL